MVDKYSTVYMTGCKTQLLLYLCLQYNVSDLRLNNDPDLNLSWAYWYLMLVYAEPNVAQIEVSLALWVNRYFLCLL